MPPERAALGILFVDLAAVEEYRECAGVVSGPVLVGHRLAVGSQPANVGDARVGVVSLQKFAAPERWLGAAQLDQTLGVRAELMVGVLPVEPGDLVVLAPAVVVAALSAGDLVAADDHRHALGKEQRGQQIPALAGSQIEDPGIVGWSLDAAVPGAVLIVAVAVVLEVGLVVLLVVGDEVVECDAVVRGDEVDRRQRAPTAAAVEILRAGKPPGKRGKRRLPRQKSRIVSQYSAFHSRHNTGKLPT
jgi:hypothetical protein